MSNGPREQTGRLSSVRWLSILAGVALIAVAFVAVTRVDNTRQGLIAEVITYLGGLSGLILLFYGLFARPHASASDKRRPSKAIEPEPKIRTANDLVLGTAGILVAIVLVSGLAITSGTLWAFLGFVVLLPMVAGSFYLSLRFLRSPTRDWRVDLRPFHDAAREKKHPNDDQSGGPDHVPVDKSQVVGEKKKAYDEQDQTEGN
jgi:hypothetical protein